MLQKITLFVTHCCGDSRALNTWRLDSVWLLSTLEHQPSAAQACCVAKAGTLESEFLWFLFACLTELDGEFGQLGCLPQVAP